jgi:membrane-associated phospholipid phosphatase
MKTKRSTIGSLLTFLLLTVCLMNSLAAWSQTDSTFTIAKEAIPQTEKSSSQKVYKIHLGWEVPVALGLIGASSLGYKWMDQRASLTEAQVLALNPQSVNSFDRPAAFYDPAGFKDAQGKSDILMTVFVASPLLLVLDKRIRRDWADMLGMLLVAHGADNTIFFSTLLLVRSPRPLTYNPAIPLESKTGVGKTNSFPSGHVSWAATSTFFIAKVYTDYHHIKGWKRMLFYTGAAIPPTIVGYYRVHAGSHFASDAIIGGLLGAVVGIATPELHRITKKVDGLSMKPFFMNGANGLSLQYVIK